MKLTSIADLQVPGAQILEQTAWDLTKIYDNFLDTFPADDSHEREAGIHATELNNCLRQVVYTLFSTPKVADVERMWRKKFEVGRSIHDMLQRHFRLMCAHMAANSNGRLTFEDEVRVQDTPLGRELYLTSSCDGIFTFLDDAKVPFLRVGTEIKTKSDAEYKKLDGPEDKHVQQAHLYMAALDLPLTWILYWNKSNEHYTPSIAPYLIRFDPNIWQKLEDRARIAIDFANRQELPHPEVGMGCRWCPYAYTCNPPTERQTRVLTPIRRR